MANTASRYRISRGWITLCVILILVIALLIALIWGLDREHKRAQREQQLAGLLAQSFYELVDHVDNLSNDLTKLMVSSSPGVNTQLLSRMNVEAQSAANALASLPGGHRALEGAMSFLNRTADMASALLKKTGGGMPLSREDMTQLSSLGKSCGQVMERLSQVDPMALNSPESGDYYEGSPEGDGVAEALYGGETAVEYPSLIYDGPFSDSLKGLRPLGLENMTETDEEGARQAAARALWVEPEELSFAGVENGTVEAWLFEGNTGGVSYTAAITQRGGKLLWMLADREISQVSLDMAEAERLALSAAGRWGFEGMRVSWSQMADGMATISLIGSMGEAGVYPDMVKIKVAMDNGEILGMDASAYWMNHRTRSFEDVSISREEAAALASPQLSVDRVRLAVIPTDGGGEKMCWEVDAHFGESRFFVYLDGQTGQEIRIFRVVRTDEGILTMRAE